MALTLVSYYYLTSFSYDGKKARDVGVFGRCHLNNIMPDGIFYDSMGWGITIVFLSIKEWIQLFYHYRTNGLGINLSYKELNQMGLICL